MRKRNRVVVMCLTTLLIVMLGIGVTFAASAAASMD